MTQRISQPEVTVSLVPSQALVGLTEHKLLVIGQKNGGSATAGALVTSIQNDNSWDDLFGSDSMIAGMCRNARKVNTETRMDAISLDDNGGGSAAAGDFTIAGTATENGSITFIVGSADDHSYEIAVSEGDAAATVATALNAAIAADANVPVTSAPTTGTVDLTAVNAGTVGNQIGLSVDGEVSGLTVTITAMTGGAVDPSFTTLFDVIEDQRYQTIIWPYSDDVDTIKDFLDGRFNVVDDVLDGYAWIPSDDTFANLDALGNAHNSQTIVILGDEAIDRDALKGGQIVELPYAKASQCGGIDALGLTEGSNFSRYAIGRGSKDRFGGAHIASLPYFNRPIPPLPLGDVQDGFTRTEIEALQDDGVSVIGNNRTNTQVLFGEIVTTYKTTPAGNDDITWKYLNYVRTSSVIREFYFNNLKDRFAQSRLTEGKIHPGYDETNKAVIEAFCTSLYQELANIVLVQDGEEQLQFYKDNLQVELDIATGTVQIAMVTPIVTQLRNIQAVIRIEFTVEG